MPQILGQFSQYRRIDVLTQIAGHIIADALEFYVQNLPINCAGTHKPFDVLNYDIIWNLGSGMFLGENLLVDFILKQPNSDQNRYHNKYRNPKGAIGWHQLRILHQICGPLAIACQFFDVTIGQFDMDLSPGIAAGLIR